MVTWHFRCNYNSSFSKFFSAEPTRNIAGKRRANSTQGNKVEALRRAGGIRPSKFGQDLKGHKGNKTEKNGMVGAWCNPDFQTSHLGWAPGHLSDNASFGTKDGRMIKRNILTRGCRAINPNLKRKM